MLNGIESNALPIEEVLMAIYNQCKSISAVGVVPKKVQKQISCCFPLQKLIFASNSKRKSDLQNGLDYIEREALPNEVVLKKDRINVQQWLKLFLFQRRFRRNFSVVSPFKNSFLPQIHREKVTYKCVQWH